MQSNLPLSDRDPNTSGRTSRASHLSGGSKTGISRSHQHNHHSPSFHSRSHSSQKPKQVEALLSAAPGVIGMLRTTTELGDVASLIAPRNQYYRGPARKSTGFSRISNGSANSLSVDRSHHRRGWPSVSSAGRRRSITSSLTAPPFLGPNASSSSNGNHSFTANIDRPETPSTTHYGQPLDQSGRSLSMSMSIPMTNDSSHNAPLTNYRSLSSLRSSGFQEAYPRPSSPFKYPTRLKRPGYRPSSPALSDIVGHSSSKYPPIGIGFPKQRPHVRSNKSTPKYALPYPTHRNKSAPAVATILSVQTPQVTRRHQDDTSSLIDSISYTVERPLNQYRSNLSNQSNQTLSLDPSSSSPNTPKSYEPINPVTISSQKILSNNSGHILQKSNTVMYYDYTEEYDLEKELTEVYNETMPESPMPVGFLDRVRAILEQSEKSSDISMAVSSHIASPQNSLTEPILLDLSEITASPKAARCITRELIMEALAPSSNLLDPESSLETEMDMTSTAPEANASLEVEADNSTQQLDDSLEDEDYHSVASRQPSLRSKISNPFIPKTYKLAMPIATPQSTRSMVSFIIGNSDIEAINFTADKQTSLPPTLSISPPPIITNGNESVIDKVKRHWSLRRAAVGPYRQRSGSASMPDIPNRTSSISQISKNSTTVADLDELSVRKGSITLEFSRPADSNTLENRLFQVAQASPLVAPKEQKSILIEVSTTKLEAPLTSSEKPEILLEYSLTSSHDDITEEITEEITEVESSVKPDLVYKPSIGTSSQRVIRKPINSSNGPGFIDQTAAVLLKSFNNESVKAEWRSTILRGVLPNVKEEPGLESSTDLRQSNAITTIDKRPESKSESEKNRPKSGVKALVETIRSFREHRASFGSGSLKDIARGIKDRQSHHQNPYTIESLHLKRKPITDANIINDNPKDHFRKKLRKVSISSVKGTMIPKNQDKEKLSLVDSPIKSIPTITTSPADPGILKEEHSIHSLHLIQETSSKSIDQISKSNLFKETPKGLLEAHAIPSLNFSHMNLLSKLNDALESRRVSLGSEFIDMIIPPSPRESPKRHSNATLIQEKYKSMFLSFDELDNAQPEDFPQFLDSPENTDLNVAHQAEEKETGTDPRVSILRPLSLEEFLNEIQRISVPSVSGLTQRLSEWIPSLRQALTNGEAEEFSDRHRQEVIQLTLNKIRELKKLDDDEAIEFTELAMKWGNSVLEKATTMYDISNNLPVRPFSVPPVETSFIPDTIHITPKLGRIRSFSASEVDGSLIDRVDHRYNDLDVQMGATSPVFRDPRPWNLESSYPWSSSIPFFEIRYPVTPSLSPDVKEHHSQSAIVQTIDTGTDDTADGNTTGGITVPLKIDTTDSLYENDDGASQLPVMPTNRGHSRKGGLLGSISNRVFQRSGAAPSETSGKHTLLTEATDRAVDPGDRYPVTGLSPPSALNLDDVHSFFSDDSNESQGHDVQIRPRVSDLRKRFTSSLRARLPGHLIQQNAHDENKSVDKFGSFPSSSRQTQITPSDTVLRLQSSTSSSSENVATPSPSHNVALNGRTIDRQRQSAPAPLPSGMSRTEVKAKRFVDKIKFIIWRSGFLLRSISGRKRDDLQNLERWSETGESLVDLRVPVGGESGYDAGRTVMGRKELGAFGA